MNDAVNKIVSLSSDPGFISDLEKQQIEEYARGVALEKSNAKAKNEGKIEGKNEEKIEIAKNMLLNKIDINVISDCTGLSVEKIEKL